MIESPYSKTCTGGRMSDCIARIMIGRVGGVDLAVGRRVGQVDGQIAGGGVDGRLHVARRAVHIAVQVELDGDRAAAQRADGGDFGHAGNLAQAPFQRRGQRGGDRGRVGAGQRRPRR